MSLRIRLRNAAVGLLVTAGSVLSAPTAPIPAPTTDVPLAAQSGKETAVFAGG